MNLSSPSFDDGAPIPSEFAFQKPDPRSHAVFADNRNPALEWSDVPAGTLSLVLICVDPDAPTVGDDVNVEGRSVSASLARADFHHWVMADVPPHVPGLGAGECSDGVVTGGKLDPPGPPGARQGVNDYTGWFASDPEMSGTYKGYDGPAPPWNDERVHRYRFELFALDLERLPVEVDFDATAVREAMANHVLARASWTGTYTLNPNV